MHLKKLGSTCMVSVKSFNDIGLAWRLARQCVQSSLPASSRYRRMKGGFVRTPGPPLAIDRCISPSSSRTLFSTRDFRGVHRSRVRVENKVETRG